MTFNLSSLGEQREGWLGLDGWPSYFKVSVPQRKEKYRGGHARHPPLASVCIPHMCAHTEKDGTTGWPCHVTSAGVP